MNPLKAEYFLPSVVSSLLADNKATVQVLHSNDKWYGVTYKEDKATVVACYCRFKTARHLSDVNLHVFTKSNDNKRRKNGNEKNKNRMYTRSCNK